MGESRQVARTKERIRSAFMRLLQTRDFKDITMKVLAEEAGVNRSTVYAHYGTLYGVLGDCMVANAGSAHLHIPSADDPDFEESLRCALRDSFQGILNHPEMYSMGTRYQSKFGMAEHIMVCRACTDEFYKGLVEELFRLHPRLEISLEYLMAMFEGACSSLVSKWVADGFRETPDELSSLAVRAFDGIVASFDPAPRLSES